MPLVKMRRTVERPGMGPLLVGGCYVMSEAYLSAHGLCIGADAAAEIVTGEAADFSVVATVDPPTVTAATVAPPVGTFPAPSTTTTSARTGLFRRRTTEPESDG